MKYTEKANTKNIEVYWLSGTGLGRNKERLIAGKGFLLGMIKMSRIMK